MNSGYERFIKTIESAHGKPFSSPFSQLLAGTIDYTMISNCLDDSNHQALENDPQLENIHRWLRTEVDPEKIERDQKIPEDYLKRLRKLGCMHARIPVEYGGAGVSQYKFSRILELIASRSEILALVVSVQQLGVVQGLLSLKKLEAERTLDEREQGESLRGKYLKNLAEYAIGAFCLTTPETGSDPSRLQTIAEVSPDRKYFQLNGTWKVGGKLYTTLGTVADIYLMLAVVVYPGEDIADVDPRKRITAFLVDRSSDGLSVMQLQFCGWRGLPNAAINLENVRVPDKNRVGRVGDGLKIAFMNLASGRVNISAICLGIMKQSEQIARWWGAERVQGGKRIGEHALNTIHLVNMNASIYAVESFLRFVTALAENPDNDIRLEAAMLKLFASQTVIEIVDETLQLRGGRGYETYASQNHRGDIAVAVERLYRSARMMKIGEGGSNVLLLYIMRCLLDQTLSDYKILSAENRPVIEKIRRLSTLGLRCFSHCFLSGLTPDCNQPVLLRPHFSYIIKAKRRFNRLVFGKIAGEALNYCWRITKNNITVPFDRFRATRRLPSNRVRVPTPVESFEQRQVLLGHFANIATNLSMMAVTCLRAAKDPDPAAVELADEFCKRAQQTIALHYLNLTHHPRKIEQEKTARGLKIMNGGYAKTVEQGVVPFDIK